MKLPKPPFFSVFAAFLFVGTWPAQLFAQETPLLEQLFQELVETLEQELPANEAPTKDSPIVQPGHDGDANPMQPDHARLLRLLSIARQGTREIISLLPQESQQAIADQRRELMDAIASGVEDLSGEDIERWLESSDNAVLQSLARDDRQNINVQGIVERLKQQSWYGKHDTDLARLLTQTPDIIKRDTHRSGRPVVFVNGITTTRAMAIEMADKIAAQLDRPVHLLHNATFLEQPWTTGLNAEGYANDDLSECFYDRIWPTTVVNRLNRLGADGLQKMAQGRDSVGDANAQSDSSTPTLQGNPTSAQLTRLLLDATEPVDLVTHSQGCMIARNAMFALAMLGKESQVQNRIAWIACGVPMSDSEVTPKPVQTTIINDKNDLVAQVASLRGNVEQMKSGTHSFINTYCPQLKPQCLWHETPAKTLPAPR